MNMRLFQHTSRILRLDRALSMVVAISSSAIMAGVLVTGAFAQTDDPVQQGRDQQTSACILVGNCNQPNSAGGGAPAYANKFAAIALSDSTLATGWSWNANSQAEAERLALASCAKHARDCKVQMWGENECLALATSEPDGSWGVDYDRNGAKAKAKALALCRNLGGQNCVVKADPCAHDE
jgi:hypothetical protein